MRTNPSASRTVAAVCCLLLTALTVHGARAKCSGTAARCQSLISGSIPKPILINGLGTFNLDYRGSEYAVVFRTSVREFTGNWEFARLYAVDPTLGLVKFGYNNEYRQSRITIHAIDPTPHPDVCPAVGTHEMYFKFDFPALNRSSFNKQALILQTAPLDTIPPYGHKFDLQDDVDMYDGGDTTLVVGVKLRPDNTGIDPGTGIQILPDGPVQIVGSTFTARWTIHNQTNQHLILAWFAFSTPSVTITSAQATPRVNFSPPGGNAFTYAAIQNLQSPSLATGATYSAAGPTVAPHLVEHVPVVLDTAALHVELQGTLSSMNPDAGITIHAVSVIGPKLEGSRQTCFFDPGCDLSETDPPTVDVPRDTDQRLFRVEPSVPNPTGSQARIRYVLGEDARVIVRVFDVSGRLVRTVFEGVQQPGAHETVWRGDDENHIAVRAGAYVYEVRAGDQTRSGKMMLVR